MLTSKNIKKRTGFQFPVDSFVSITLHFFDPDLYRLQKREKKILLQLANFPFDEQTCRLRFTSYNGPTTELIVRGNVSTTMDLDELVNNSYKYILYSHLFSGKWRVGLEEGVGEYS